MKTSLLCLSMALCSISYAKPVLHCSSALDGPRGASTMILETDGSLYKLVYRPNLSVESRILADNLNCGFSEDDQMPFVTFCQNETFFINIRQTIEAQLYGKSGVLKFDFVTFTVREDLHKFEFKTRTDKCELAPQIKMDGSHPLLPLVALEAALEAAEAGD